MRIDRHIAVAVLALATTAASAPEPRAGGAVPQVTNHESPADALGIALEGYPYPWPVHFLPLTIEGQDVRMAYMDVPPENVPESARASAPVVVLLHGKNFGGYYWAETARAVAGAGYRVVIPDQIGWGKSSKPEIRYSFQLLAANTARLLDSLGVAKAALLGHSTGGMLAVRFTLMYPERVTRLILEDPIGLEDYRINIPAQTDETLYQAELANTDVAKIRAFYARYFAHPQPSVYEPLADVQIRVTRSGEYARWAKASALAYQMIYQQPVRYEYRLLAPPTLVIVGDRDRTVPMGSYA
ncbi:MAG TPA: alpha/beta hydrolase, partial [Candidatus Acidoferrales bacterium]|nr:alpha/beta hydrolase [Candidatus Acidoferrales bacterium]